MARAALLSRVLTRPRLAKRPAAKPAATPAAGRTAGPSKWFGRAFTKRSAPASAKRTQKTSGKRSTAPSAKGKPKPRRTLLAALGRALAMACAFAFMVAFAVVLAKLTLQPSPASEALTHTNLRPGDSLQAYLDQPQLRDAVKQIGGNLLLGVPFGVLVPVLAPRARGVIRVLVLTAVVMLAVELAQGAMITGRAFDIDDVILNTTGALTGYLLVGRRLGRAVHARHG